MTRFPVILLSLLAVGAILWITVFGASGPAPREKTKKAPTQRRGKPRLRLAGHVQTKDGTPVKGATVFVLPKKRPGLMRSDADHEVTRADGRWALYTRTTVDRWIGVVAPGYRNAWLDGDTVDPKVQMFLIVEPVPPTTVRILWPDGSPVKSKGVQIEPWPPGATYFLPGPNARQGERWGVTNSQGEVKIQRGTTRPLTVAPNVEGHHTRPARAWLAGKPETFTFTALPNASLELELTDIQGAALKGLVTVEFGDPATGASLFTLNASTPVPGHLTLARAVPPGTYNVQIGMDGRRAWYRPDVTIPAGQTAARIQARLHAATKPGGLTVTLVGNNAGLQPGARRRAPMVFFRRGGSGTGWKRRGWRAGAPESWAERRQRFMFRLEPGVYDVLISDVLSGRAVLESEIFLTAGRTRELELRMQPGQRGELPAMEKDGVYALGLTVIGEDGGKLPVFGGTRSGKLRSARELGVIQRGLQGERIFLGPYPLDTFTLEMRRSDGTLSKKVYE